MAKEGDSILRVEIDVRSKTVVSSSIRGNNTMSFETFFTRYMTGEPFSSLDENYSFHVIQSFVNAKENHVAMYPYTDKNGALILTFIWMPQFPDIMRIIVTELDSRALGTGIHSVDSLTGLTARSHFIRTVNNRIKKHDPFSKCGFLLIDVNNFKKINDDFGHRIGDECLRGFANKLREIAPDAILGRFGGDEFVIFIDDVTELDLVEYAKKTLATQLNVKAGHKNIVISCCCGISMMTYSGAEFSLLLERADKSLRLAKGKTKKEAYLDGKLVAKFTNSGGVSVEEERKKIAKPRLYKDEIAAKRAKWGILAALGAATLLAFSVFALSRFFILNPSLSTTSTEIFITMVITTALLFVSGILFALACALSGHRKVLLLNAEYIDQWTGSINYERFLIDGPKIVEGRSNVAVLEFNVVRYKYILETIGKEKSDMLILGLYKTILAGMVDDSEVVVRFYGDRFVALMHEDSYEEIVRRVKSIQISIEQYISVHYDLKAEVIVGVYYPGKEITDFQAAISRAHIAQQHIDKTYLTDTIVQYKDEMMLHELNESAFEQNAKKALFDGHYQVVYQAKKDLINNTWVGLEGLFRWNDPTKGILSPVDTIPMLEKSGLINDVDILVFKNAINVLVDQKRSGIRPLPISVNVSSRHLLKSDWIDEYKKILEENEIEPSLIEFELSEAAFLSSEKAVLEAVDNIHKLGAKVALDDFGKGPSSLDILRRVAFDTVKMDGIYFVTENGLDEKSRKLLRHLVDICRDLGKRVIFERVDSKLVADTLKICGIQYVQGYIYSKPAPQDECLKLIRRPAQPMPGTPFVKK
ncbi:MAG: EAL domain-containing protein [Bacilli bacterium]|nr:EAL domain-containing protein [Bacilli bacterium]